MLRLLLSLLPFLALSTFFPSGEGDDPPAGDDDDDDDGEDPDGDDPQTFTQDEVDKIVSRRLARERRQERDALREEIRRELEEEVNRTQAEEAEEYKPLYESEREKREKAEREAQEAEERARQKLTRAAILEAATGQNFIAPHDAYRFVDFEEVEYDEDGDPLNVDDLVSSIAESHAYLLKDEESSDNGKKSIQNVKPQGTGKLSSEEKTRRYVEQGKRRRFRS